MFYINNRYHHNYAMESSYISTSDLEQEIKRIFFNMKSQYSSRSAEVFRQSQIVTGASGVLRLAAAPYYCLTFDNGIVERPLTLVDSAKNLCQWISVIGKTIFINQLIVICEKFQRFQKNEDLHSVTIIVDWEDIMILEYNHRSKQKAHLPNHQLNAYYERNSTVKSECMNTDVILENETNDINLKEQEDWSINLKIESEHVTPSNNVCRVLVHHITLPFYVNEPPAVCFALISYSDGRHVEVKLWLVLKGEQVAMREFFVPNREYIIQFPLGTMEHYFDKCQKPLIKIFSNPSKELRILLHHKEIFSSFNGSEIPIGTKVFLTRNTQFSNIVQQFHKDPMCSWYSVDEADSASANLITIYGEVDAVIYMEEVIFKSCHLCIRAKPRQFSNTLPQFSTPTWMNPWKSQLSFESDKLLLLPSCKENNNVMKTGIPGNMVQIIKMRDVITGSERSIYLKHSHTPCLQQLFSLSKGMVLCITHLNRRHSNAGKYYYITTLLSSVRVLACPIEDNPSEGWGLLGLYHLTQNLQEKIWGVFESLNLVKIAVRAKCKNCSAVFYRRICSNKCSVPEVYTTSVYAIGWLQIIHNQDKCNMEKVLIKDTFVQKLLCIPGGVWQMFLKAATDKEIFCFISDHNIPEPENTSSKLPMVGKLFKMYCSIPKPKGKFFISVKRISFSGGDPMYYCIHLDPVNKCRLTIVAESTNQVAKCK